MKKVIIYLGIVPLTILLGCSPSREERVMKKDFDIKSCGPRWQFGFDFGTLAKIADDSERDCEWAISEYGYMLKDEKEKDCFCAGFLSAYDLKEK